MSGGVITRDGASSSSASSSVDERHPGGRTSTADRLPGHVCCWPCRRAWFHLKRLGEMAVSRVSRVRAWLRALLTRRREKKVTRRWSQRQKKFNRDVNQMVSQEEREYKIMESRQKASEELEDQGVGFISTYYSTIHPSSAVENCEEPDDEVIAVYLANRDFLEQLMNEVDSLGDLEGDDDSDADEGDDSEKQRDPEYFKRRLATMKRSTKRKVAGFIQLFEARRNMYNDRASLISLDELRREEDDPKEEATDHL